jgi:putative FmdB family regulatory protein
MPIFEYKCAKCGQVTEFLEKSAAKTTHTCPGCGAKDMQKMLSTFAPMVKQRTSGGKCGSCPENSCPYSGD